MVSKIFVCPDGSIVPQITTGNTMAPCVIIGERAARSARTGVKQNIWRLNGE